MTRYHVEYYSKETGDMICWYSTGSKADADKQAQHRYTNVTVKVKEVRYAQH